MNDTPVIGRQCAPLNLVMSEQEADIVAAHRALELARSAIAAQRQPRERARDAARAAYVALLDASQKLRDLTFPSA